MRSAPPVSLSCHRGGAWRALHVAVPALAAGVAVACVLLHRELAIWPAAAVASASAAGVAMLAWRFTHAAPVLLAFDGQRWLADGEPGDLHLMIDLGPWMLLRWHGGAHTLWLPASAGTAGAHWHALRVAAHSTTRTAAHV